MKKIAMLFCLFMAAKVSHGQIKGGGGVAGPLTVIDNEGYNVNVVACTNLQCPPSYTFVSDPGTHTFTGFSTPYTFMDLTWTLPSGSQLLFHVILANVDAAPGGVLYTYNGSAMCRVTKESLNTYSFILETALGGN